CRGPSGGTTDLEVTLHVEAAVVEFDLEVPTPVVPHEVELELVVVLLTRRFLPAIRDGDVLDDQRAAVDRHGDAAGVAELEGPRIDPVEVVIDVDPQLTVVELDLHVVLLLTTFEVDLEFVAVGLLLGDRPARCRADVVE